LDQVNLAARLESMCKQYGVEVLISGRMRRLAGDAFLARRIDRVVAYGRRGATDIYELVATQGTARPDQVAPRGPAAAPLHA
jgi:adenylate cyclase